MQSAKPRKSAAEADHEEARRVMLQLIAVFAANRSSPNVAARASLMALAGSLGRCPPDLLPGILVSIPTELAALIERTKTFLPKEWNDA